MFRYVIVLHVISCCALLSSAQEVSNTQVFNRTQNGRLVNPLNYDYPESDLWLIARDDPIPVKLNGQWPLDDAVLRGQAVNAGRNAYGSRLPNRQRYDNPEETSLSQQAPLSVISRDAGMYYDRTITSENGRLSTDGSGSSVRNPEAVLVQLPVEITQGMWERATPQEQYVNGRQTALGRNVNTNYEGVASSDKISDVPTVFVPVKELTSRLPNTEIFAESEVRVPLQQQYYEAPFYRSNPLREGTSSVSTAPSSQPESNEQEIWILTQDAKIPPTSENSTTKHVEENLNTHASVREGSVLTNEDIELLERLGILSSFVLEPISPENTTSEITEISNFQREYESKPVLIDNVGRSSLVNSERENTTSIRDFVFIDLPFFTPAEYHSDIPENADIDRGKTRISPYVTSRTVDATKINASYENKVENNTYLNGREIMEILQLLSLNTGDIFNLSSPVLAPTQPKLSENRENNENITGNRSPSDNVQYNMNNSLKIEVNKQPAAANSFPGTVNFSESNETLKSLLDVTSQPSVANGRIQPRRLDTPALKENEILERLIKKAIPISESKLEILKKLEIQPRPYVFGFRQNDENGTFQHRNEASDSKGVVKGTYGYRDAMGVYRNVSYIADNSGFHAVVKTNEPGTVSHNTADVVFMAETPPLAALVKMMAYRKPKFLSNITDKP